MCGVLLGPAVLLAHGGADHSPPPAADAATDPRARMTRVRALTAAHRFDMARAQLEALVREHPRLPGAWVALGDVARVQGRWGQARGAAFQALRAGGGLAARALTAAVGAGPLPARLAGLERGLAEATGDPASRGYAHGVAADLAARLGRTAAARAHLDEGLAWTPGDAVLLAQAADLELAAGDRIAAALRLDPTDERDPILLRRALADPAGFPTHSWYRLGLRLRAARAAGDAAHAREEARLLLDLAHEPGRALEAALANWALQREGEDAWLLLRAAVAAGRPEAAAPVLAWAEGYGDDVRLEPWLSQLSPAP